MSGDMRLNLGSGNIPLKGFVNVDLVEPADVVGDLLDLEFSDVEEVEMSHVLEHVSFRLTDDVLRRVRSWMRPGAPIRVEVPDCDVLAHMDPREPDWQQWVFGAQGEPGQFHCAGFVAETLRAALERAGFTVTETRRFASTNINRPGYPCIEARGVA